MCTEEAGGEDFIVAYGDGSLPLAMKGMDGGSSAHKRLMMPLSKRVRIVMTNKYWTTKACPKRKNNGLSMKRPKGYNRYYNSRQETSHKKGNTWTFSV